jgi:hypothetical protein
LLEAKNVNLLTNPLASMSPARKRKRAQEDGKGWQLSSPLRSPGKEARSTQDAQGVIVKKAKFATAKVAEAVQTQLHTESKGLKRFEYLLQLIEHKANIDSY